MELKPHEHRVVTERDELTEKLEKLEIFIKTSLFESLSIKDRNLLIEQGKLMDQYLSVLNERIGRFVK
jgi:hypothetical protein